MELTPLAFDAPLSAYNAQADMLLAGWRAGDENAIRVFRQRHPTFLDARIPWLQRNMAPEDVRAIPIDREDAQLALARFYDFGDWQRLGEYVEAVSQSGSTVARFGHGPFRRSSTATSQRSPGCPCMTPSWCARDRRA